jgi:hypothetical protein
MDYIAAGNMYKYETNAGKIDNTLFVAADDFSIGLFTVNGLQIGLAKW